MFENARLPSSLCAPASVCTTQINRKHMISQQAPNSDSAHFRTRTVELLFLEEPKNSTPGSTPSPIPLRAPPRAHPPERQSSPVLFLTVGPKLLKSVPHISPIFLTQRPPGRLPVLPQGRSKAAQVCSGQEGSGPEALADGVRVLEPGRPLQRDVHVPVPSRRLPAAASGGSARAGGGDARAGLPASGVPRRQGVL
eukprot:366549-Chlamydomonas_euryale.AAC.7